MQRLSLGHSLCKIIDDTRCAGHQIRPMQRRHGDGVDAAQEGKLDIALKWLTKKMRGGMRYQGSNATYSMVVCTIIYDDGVGVGDGLASQQVAWNIARKELRVRNATATVIVTSSSFPPS